MPTRACKQNDRSYCEFMASDCEGSDFAEGSDITDEDEKYDAEKERLPKYDHKRGEENWVGRRVLKSFGDHGNFEGIVYAFDNDNDNEGYRLFLVHYFDDPDDTESMWPNELMR